MSNITEILGHLGADPEIRFTSSGQKVIALRLAVNSRRNGKDETTWWNVTVWEDRCRIEKMMPYLKKGSALIIVGEMQARLWTDKEGRPQISHDLTADFIRFSPFGKPDSAKQEGTGSAQAPANPYQDNAPKSNGYGNQPYNAQPQNNSQPQSNYSGSTYGQNQSASMNQTADDDHIPF